MNKYEKPFVDDGYRVRIVRGLELELRALSFSLKNKYSHILLNRFLEIEKDVQIQLSYMQVEGE